MGTATPTAIARTSLVAAVSPERRRQIGRRVGSPGSRTPPSSHAPPGHQSQGGSYLLFSDRPDTGGRPADARRYVPEVAGGFAGAPAPTTFANDGEFPGGCTLTLKRGRGLILVVVSLALIAAACGSSSK